MLLSRNRNRRGHPRHSDLRLGSSPASVQRSGSDTHGDSVTGMGTRATVTIAPPTKRYHYDEAKR
jgi:hypothetical protein